MRKLATGIYLFKVNNGNTRSMCGICLKITIQTSERRQSRRFCVFIHNFELISLISLVFLLLTLNKWVAAGTFTRIIFISLFESHHMKSVILGTIFLLRYAWLQRDSNPQPLSL